MQRVKFFFIKLITVILLLQCLQVEAKQQFSQGVVVSKNEIASKVGADILAKGGNAIDAAIGTGYTIGVVEPQGSGIGGGGFALIYLAKTKKLIAVDFRERAPQNINKYPYEFRIGPKAAGIPGTVAGLEYLRKKYGKLDRKQDIEPVIKVARQGFPVNKTLNYAITVQQENIRKFESTKKIYLPNDKVPQIGDVIKQIDLANSLEKIEKGGTQEFYEGGLAKTITDEAQKVGGFLTLNDLKNYKVHEVQPICSTYRGKKICSFPPPSSGGVCIIEALNILENFNMPSYQYTSPERIHYVIEALKFSFADRATKLGDPRFNKDLNINELTSKDYAKKIAERIKTSEKAIPSSKVYETAEKPQTTHFTVADKDGNIVAMTMSLNGHLGSKFVVPDTGILLNNTLDDFSLPDSKPNQFGLIGNDKNFPAPDKTPLSSMSPTIVFDNDKPVLALGSPGGPTIISAVFNTLLAYIDNQMTVEQAVAAGRVHHQWMPDEVYAEKSLIDEKTQKTLEDKYNYNFPKDNKSVWSRFYWNIQAIELNQNKQSLKGVSDPRTEQGVVYEKKLGILY
ncbi:MAG: gamma-glutamyltransferase [bacterium]